MRELIKVLEEAAIAALDQIIISMNHTDIIKILILFHVFFFFQIVPEVEEMYQLKSIYTVYCVNT